MKSDDDDDKFASKDLRDNAREKKKSFYGIEKRQISFQGCTAQQHVSSICCQWRQTTRFLHTGLRVFLRKLQKFTHVSCV